MAKTRKKRKTKTRRKTKQKTQVPTKNLLGLTYVLVAILGYFGRGFLGILVANMFRIFVGSLSPILFIILFIYGLYLLFMGKELSFNGITDRVIGLSLTLLGYLLWVEYQFASSLRLENGFISRAIDGIERSFLEQTSTNDVGGGIGGATLYTATHFLLSSVGSMLFSVILMGMGLVVLFGIPFDQVLEKIGIGFAWTIRHAIASFKSAANNVYDWFSNLDFSEKEQSRTRNESSKTDVTRSMHRASKPVVEVTKTDEKVLEEPIVDGTRGTEHPIEPKIEIATTNKIQRKPKNQVNNDDLEINSGFDSESKTNPNYRLPSSELLTEIPQTDQSSEYSSIKKNTKILQDTLNSFGVDASVESVKMGPSVTEYEIHPAIGVKVSKIVGLADDLALALAAKDIRIEAPIPGKSLIGIEVPNRTISTVSFRDIIESQPAHPEDPLKVPVGRDVSGNLVEANLVKMQHLLIAGATGSGKSVMINVIITGILMNARPDEVKLILIDPKKVELGIYNDIPHLLTPVVTDARKAAKALHKVVAEMQHRYDLFAELNQRNIKSYNDFIEEQNAADGMNRPKMPYIVVVVDELSDLMMVASNEVEDAIIRLAQLARAAGIHMIIATQRPSVNVVTGLIKANVPSRIAFAVASGIDSRTIIDANGAEKLLGRGDMLFFPMGQNKPERVQGAFVSDHDVKEIIDFVKKQQSADYDETLDISDQEIEENDSGELDEYYAEAVQLVTDMQRASTSMLQRKFRVGYNRAARIMDQLEDNGIIGPQEGSKPRKVYREKE
ncbi:FtsK/SpoIIIE family DNA translocase [Pediococcus pentosaceus]|uniref:FtsK/SpoIIIE family DNA translocase n=1 Tax=Pediococcus pentosaceus TaxID=1255 RepID=UPI001373DD5E|nr:DNA translocase FtsK [Pediococcus pentosaceus]QHO66939.1 DNA translocase FtsK [Pediococcus pentosaceus]